MTTVEINGWQQAIYNNTKALGGLEVKVDRLETTAGRVEEKLSALDRRVGGLEGKVEGLAQQIERLEKEMSAVKETVTKLEQKVAGIQGLVIAILIGVLVNIFSQPILSALAWN